MMEVWAEKHRPTSLAQIKGNPEAVESIAVMIRTHDMPNLLFEGVPGTGKTALAHVIANEILGEAKADNFREFNAGDERTLQIVRDRIKKVALRHGKTAGVPFRIIYLSEIEGMTPDAQRALRRIIEMANQKNVRFIMDCNNVRQVEPALQSRCALFTIRPVDYDNVLAKLEEIATAEGVVMPPDCYNWLAQSARGDLRNAIMRLQACKRDKPIDLDFVKGIAPSPTKPMIDELMRLNWQRGGEMWYRNREEKLQEILAVDPNLQQTLEIMFDGFERDQYLDYTDKPPVPRWKFMKVIGDYQRWCAQGNPVHQFRCCLMSLREMAGIV